ncbi:hypothetical protein [Veillonella sp.]|uniref:hypothetical protein n=1 Tax=Veillonella sp. TaxID=1926307 RepID=UPI0025D939BB|nr:hypothetical protein [Veillonella sp.]
MNRTIIKEEAMLLFNPLRLKEFCKWNPLSDHEKELKKAVLKEFCTLYKQQYKPKIDAIHYKGEPMI